MLIPGSKTERDVPLQWIPQPLIRVASAITSSEFHGSRQEQLEQIWMGVPIDANSVPTAQQIERHVIKTRVTNHPRVLFSLQE